jgi:hypothetical protein
MCRALGQKPARRPPRRAGRRYEMGQPRRAGSGQETRERKSTDLKIGRYKGQKKSVWDGLNLEVF